jgi:hypothetical protein
VRTGYEVTLRHIALLGQQRDDLSAAKAAAEENHLRRVAFVYEAGAIGMDGLAEAYYEYRLLADPGFSRRWDTIIPVPANKVVSYARSRPQRQPNGAGGTWSGPYPFDDGPTPGDATSVAYMLRDVVRAVCYIGSTAGFRGRINRHARDGKEFTSWCAYPCTDRAEAYALEARLIREHQPYLNKTGRG